jgi:hypothetical protein
MNPTPIHKPPPRRNTTFRGCLKTPLKHRALGYGGDFTLLWRNSHLNHPMDRAFYQALVV